MLGPTRIFRIRQHAFQLLTNFDRFIKRPRAVRIQRHAGLRETFCQRGDGFRLFLTGQHAALQFEIIKAIFFVRGFRQAHHRIRGHRLVVAKSVPVALFIRLALIRQRRQPAVADKEQIAQHFHFAALLPLAQQRRNVNAQMLTQQIQHRGFNTGHHVNGGAQVEGLQATPSGIAIGKRVTHGVEDIFILAQRFAHHQRNSIFQRLADLLPARNFAHARMARIIFDNDNIAGEEWRMRAAQVHQHTVMASNRNDLHGGDYRGRKSAHRVILLSVTSKNRALTVKCPAGDQVLHRARVVTRAAR